MFTVIPVSFLVNDDIMSVTMDVTYLNVCIFVLCAFKCCNVVCLELCSVVDNINHLLILNKRKHENKTFFVTGLILSFTGSKTCFNIKHTIFQSLRLISVFWLRFFYFLRSRMQRNMIPFVKNTKSVYKHGKLVIPQ